MTTRLKTTAQPSSPRLGQLTRLIDRALERTLPSARRAPSVIHAAMRYCVLSGGKRFRPLLCLGACEAVGRPASRALTVACAIELIHTYSLVHDDLPAMDNAAQRRGQPSCHRRFGEANAILAGDALLTLAFHRLSRNGTPNALGILRILGDASGTEGLIGGQVMDLEAIRRPQTATPHDLLRVAQRKTAALITASVVTGALAGGGTPLQVRRLARYGQAVGLAFQLLDDTHDGEGLAQAMGPDAARRKARRLIERAVAAVAPFGPRAEVLRGLATWLATT